LIAIIGKVIGCGLGAYLFGQSFWESAIIGFGMKGRGVVEMVIAAVVIKLSGHLMTSQTITEPLLTKDQFSALICMSLFTTIIAPLSFKWIVKMSCSIDESTEFCRLCEKSRKA
jgi:Kef-type K+ transport system membrane component KefB